ncbi:MAG: penicillin acylase family protein, partial [Actinomycetota bacterium]|nr:penicillin acylase family protein [Actinomycetota bacterium]
MGVAAIRGTLRHWAVLIGATVLCAVVPAGAGAAVPVEPYGTNDAGGFRNVLPAGENGLDNATQLAEFQAKGTYPPHYVDQLPLYANLLYASPTLTREQIPSYYKDATFGIKEGDVGSVESPLTRTDVTIARDSSFGVPHVYGSTRAGVMFGAGYAAAQDRLFLIDVLRHTARAELASFVGGAAGNRAMDRAQWLIAPYTEADLEAQLANAPKLYGAEGEKIVADVKEFVAGINLYVTEALVDPNKMPAEYAALKQAPTEWKPTDVIAEASLIGGIFGKGGGAEVRSALALESFEKTFGKAGGRAAWQNFREHNDPEAPTTVSNAFPYETASPFSSSGLAMPDSGSVNFVNDGEEIVKAAAAARPPSSSTSGANLTDTPNPQPIPNDSSVGSQLLRGALAGPPHASNWELI